MRVMQVMAGAEHGGAEEFFVRLTVALAQAGIESHAVVRPFAERSKILRAAGVAVTEVPFRRWLDFTTERKLPAAIDSFAPDIVLSWMSRATAAMPRPARQDNGAPTFVHAGRLGGYYDLKYYRNCDHLIGNTRDIVDHIVRSGWPAGRAHYLPNFADETIGTPIPRAQLTTPEGAPLFLALGRFHPNKGFDVLLDALAFVPDAYLWLAGEGPLLDELRARAVRLGVIRRVRFLGWRSDVNALMASADALVCPSRHEPLGNVVIEAWARHLPVIAADASGPAHLIQEGKSGLLVPREDAAALAMAMVKLGRDRTLAATLAKGGRAAYQEQFSQAAVVEQYLALFDRITFHLRSAAVTDPAARG